jgi:hypothetical protein
MIVVRVELHSAITRQVTEIARMHICNFGGTRQLGNYRIETLRGRSATELSRYIVQREGTVRNHPRLQVHVWHLVGKALAAIGYVKPQPHDAPDEPSDIDQEEAA